MKPTGPMEIDMDTTKLRIRVAELCGELQPPTTKPTIAELEAILNSGENLHVTILPNGEIRALRDYCNDLNACHSFEEELDADQCAEYVRLLKRDHPTYCILPNERGDESEVNYQTFSLIHATAEQRCRAFVAIMEASSVPNGNEVR